MTSSTPTARIGVPALAFPALILANVILAMGPVFVRLTDVGPVAAGFWRLAIALPFLLLLSRRKLAAVTLTRTQWTAMAVAGLLFAADLASWHVGIHYTKVANSTVFGNVSAIMLPLWGVFVLGHRLRPVQLGALLLALAGAGIMMGGSYELSPRYLRGDLLCLLAGIFYTAYLLLMQDARQRLDGWSVLTVSSLAGAGPLLLFALAIGEKVMPTNWTPLVALALSSQVIGQGLMTYAIGWFSPLVLGLSLLLQPAVAALLGWLLFGEMVSATDIIGAVAVAVALILVRLPARA